MNNCRIISLIMNNGIIVFNRNNSFIKYSFYIIGIFIYIFCFNYICLDFNK